MIARLMARTDAWIFEEYRASTMDLAIFRIIYALFMLLTVPPVAPWIARAPHAFFSPPVSLAVLFPDFPPAWLLTMLNLGLAALLSLLLVGWKTRMVSLGTAALLLVLKSFEYSMGKINHDILLIVIPLVMAFSTWGGAWSIDSCAKQTSPEREERGQWCLSYLALLIAVGMLTAGWAKITSGWLDLSTHCTYGHLAFNNFVIGRDSLPARMALKLGPSPVWKIADWSAILLETGFIVAILKRRFWHWALIAAVLFHAAIWALFHIVFAANVLAYGAFVPFARLTGAIKLPVKRLASCVESIRGVGWVICGMSFGLTTWSVLIGRSSADILHFPVPELTVLLGVAVAAAVCILSSMRIPHEICCRETTPHNEAVQSCDLTPATSGRNPDLLD
jgi:uncharacterized membrane protein YphA (DoxX/SURF4 family)